MKQWDEVDFYLEDLKSKFAKIDPSDYYLSYSGGRDSHFLYWFIKEYAKIDGIEVVGCNTYMEHPDILKRIKENSDTLLFPKLKPMEIKEKHGIPCFSKHQDDFIDRYQRGSRAPSTMLRIHGGGDGNWEKFVINNKARKLLLDGELHKVSPKCCTYLKKEPFKEYEKKSHKKAILGVRGQESVMRKMRYKSCFMSNGKFTPLYDLSNELFEAIMDKYEIESPDVYNHVNQTGCMGCPYGSWKHAVEPELMLVTDNQFNFITNYFKESYQVLKIDIEKIRRERDDSKEV